MRSATLALLLALTAAFSAASGQGAPSVPVVSDEDAATVRALELKRFERLVAGDYDGLAALLADDLVYTHSNARVDTKESYLAPLRAGSTRYLEFTPGELSVRVYGHTAVIVGRAQTRALVSGEQRRNDLRFTDVWVQRDGRWQLVAWQATRTP